MLLEALPSTVPSQHFQRGLEKSQTDTSYLQDMSRGGKLAPEVNRYVRRPPSFTTLTFPLLPGHCLSRTSGPSRSDSATRIRASAYQPHSYNVTSEELFELFGKFGPVRYAHVTSFASPLTMWTQVWGQANKTRYSEQHKRHGFRGLRGCHGRKAGVR